MIEGIRQGFETEQTEKIEYPEIAELEQPIKIIFSSLRKEIEAGEYSLIVGLDASGRLPALVIKDAMGQIYSQKGYPKPETFFCAGFRTASSDKAKTQKRAGLKEVFAKFMNSGRFHIEANKKALIVEDSVHKGASFGPVVVMLKNLGIEADVAAITLVHSVPIQQKGIIKAESTARQSGFEVRVFVGGQGVPKIYDTPYLSGVIKHPSDVLSSGFGVSVKRKYETLRTKPDPTKKDRRDLKRMDKLAKGDMDEFFKNIQVEGINVARKDAHLVANNVTKDFLKNN